MLARRAACLPIHAGNLACRLASSSTKGTPRRSLSRKALAQGLKHETGHSRVNIRPLTTTSRGAESPTDVVPDLIFFQSRPGPNVNFIQIGDAADPPSPEKVEAAQHRVNEVDRIHRKLLEALQQKDIKRITELWDALEQFDPACFMHHECTLEYSLLIAKLLADSDPASTAGLSVLDRIAALAATKRSGHANSKGLEARIQHYLSNKNPDAAILLFKYTTTLMEQRSRYITSFKQRTVTADIRRYTNSVGLHDPPHSVQAVGLVVTACAMKDSLSDAIENVANNRYVRGAWHRAVSESIHTIASDAALRDKAVGFSDRAFAVKLCGPPFDGLPKLVARHIREAQPFSLAYKTYRLLQECLRDDSYIIQEGSPLPVGRPYFVMDTKRWAILLRGCIVSGGGDRAVEILPDLKKLLSPMPPNIWATVIDAWSTVKRFDRAEATWAQLCSTERRPGVEAYGAYIIALSREGRVQDMMDVFDCFREQVGTSAYPTNSPAVLSVFNDMLDLLLRLEQEERARSILDSMKAQGPWPNAASFGSFMWYYARQRNSQGVTSTFTELRKSGAGIDVGCAAILLSTLHSLRDDATSLTFALLRDNGIDVDRELCLTLLKRLVKLDSDDALAAAVAVLEHVEQEASVSLFPAEIARAIVLGELERRAWSDQQRQRELRKTLLRKAREANMAVEKSSHRTRHVIIACLDNPQRAAAYWALQYYTFHRAARARIGLFADQDVCSTILRGLRRRGEFKLAQTVVDDVEAAAGAFRPDRSLASELHYVKRRIPWGKEPQKQNSKRPKSEVAEENMDEE